MRQLYVEVPEDSSERAADLAREHDGLHVWKIGVHTEREGVSLLVVHLPNEQVGPYIQAVGDIAEVRITLIPRGVVAFRPPAKEAPDEVTDVGVRSPIEIVLAALQSIGSFKGFIGYAISAGVVVWIGLYTNTIYLLTASMLIAPFAGPAMNAAIGSAVGSGRLLRRSLLRYALGLCITAVTAALLSLLMQQKIATPLMIEVSQVSIVTLLLPLVAGAAGGLNLVQSERDSLVSGAAVGILVAASLAPPTGLLGMAAVMGEWELVGSAAFVLIGQLVGINFSGALLFRVFGVKAHGTRFIEGTRKLFPLALAVSAAVLVGLFMWQNAAAPKFQRSSQAQMAAYEMRQAIEESGLAETVEVDSRFTRADIQGQNTLLGVLYVQRSDGVELASEEIQRELTQRVQDRLLERGFDVTPLISVTVLDPPSSRSNGGG